ncbi:beta-ketoacyl-[acyl-carrier-protein] synthase family protein, partial [Streptomyces montanus]
MSGEVTVTGFGVRTAFGTGAGALRRGVFTGTPSFTATTRFDTGPYRTPMAAAAPDGPDAVEDWALRHALAQCGAEAVDMAGLPSDTERGGTPGSGTAGGGTAVLLGIAGDSTSITRYWRAADAASATGAADATEAAAERPADAVPARTADAVPARLTEVLAGRL